MPLVSDPGYRLVRAALAEGLPVGAVPGANAAVTALVLSGLPPLPFLVLGFPPPRQAARRAAFGRLRAAETGGAGGDADLVRGAASAGRDAGRHGGGVRCARRPRWRGN